MKVVFREGKDMTLDPVTTTGKSWDIEVEFYDVVNNRILKAKDLSDNIGFDIGFMHSDYKVGVGNNILPIRVWLWHGGNTVFEWKHSNYNDVVEKVSENQEGDE